ncbi:group RING finger 3 [Octopus vulgaris]|uniref:Group RING finger 3 n=2 Tax=Octopus TaxID=6643 RepID=A0AA36FJB5_OCTVU|nr:polycomb group RING finger protein 3-like isoform X1 [Octopus sinensis]CAI9736268.1 group RING finger 3 [Octopus vulgaris]
MLGHHLEELHLNDSAPVLFFLRSDEDVSSSDTMMERRIRLKSVNVHITCTLCSGYLIDATTITECLHTFCKSCLVQYLDDNNTCPTCEIVIHQSHPLNYISHDRTMQDIVYKLVPELQENELRRQQQFYKSRGVPFPKSIGANEECVETERTHTQPPDSDTQDYHRSDEQVNICLEGRGVSMRNLKRKFIRCSSQATIMQLKKFVALKVFNSSAKHTDIDILCNDAILGKDHTLKFISVTSWQAKDTPLMLHYRQRVDL